MILQANRPKASDSAEKPLPLNGTSYANVFVHYAPAEGWEGRYKFLPSNQYEIDGVRHSL